MADNQAPIIIKKVVKKIEGGHHGGAWKVAYADFVTAMMAFFMLLWLLNVAPPETLNGLADYFSPTTAAVVGKSGSPNVNPPKDDARGDNPSPVVVISEPGPPPSGADSGPKGGEGSQEIELPSQVELNEKIKAMEDDSFREFQEKIQVAIQKSPTLSDLKDQIVMEITEDGLKIQIIDKDRRSMFRSGSDELYGYAADLICEVSKSVKDLQNRVTIEGHTDRDGLSPTGQQTGWELSANRANAARRKMSSCGVSNDRVAEVIGKATTDPIYPDQPNRIENRRITLLLLREAPVVPPGAALN